MGDQIDRDEEHLRLLKIGHYIMAGMAAVYGCLPILHLMVGITILSGVLPLQPKPPQGPDMTDLIGWFFVGFATLIILMSWAMAGLLFAVGRCLARRRGYLFCTVVAALECLMIPLGTILGVFTLMVLTRPSVKQLFQVSDGW